MCIGMAGGGKGGKDEIERDILYSQITLVETRAQFSLNHRTTVHNCSGPCYIYT